LVRDAARWPWRRFFALKDAAKAHSDLEARKFAGSVLRQPGNGSTS
jgi:hypothetical protein